MNYKIDRTIKYQNRKAAKTRGGDVFSSSPPRVFVSHMQQNLHQFLKLWIGAGIRPPLEINFSQEYRFTGITGA